MTMSIAATHPFIDSLQHIVGFLIVVSALTLLWGITAGVGRYFIASSGGRPKLVPEPDPDTADDEPSEEEVVAIAAAVTALMGQRSRIVSIRSSAKDWNREGRREHFASHRIR